MIAIAAIFNNEAPYLKEWIEFHRLVGVEKFYLFDHMSTDPFQEILEPYIDQGIVELTPWRLNYTSYSEWLEIQCLAYDRAIRKALGKIKWLALLDIDEFLFSPKASHLKDALILFEHVGGIGINWQAFGTSGVPKIPEKRLLIETLNLKWPEDAPPNYHIKCIVRPERVRSCIDPHTIDFEPGFFQVDASGTPFTGNRTPSIQIDLLRINHYSVRDEFYFKTQKIPRIMKWREGQIAEIRIENFKGQVEDTAIHHFVPKLKQSMRVR